MIRAVFLSFLLITGCATTVPEADIAPQVDGNFFDNLFDSDYFASQPDPFQEMSRITEQQAAEAEQPARYRNAFNIWYWDRFGRYPAEQIHYREDDNAFYITLDVHQLDNPTVNMKIEGDVLMINGQLIRKARYSERKLRLKQQLPVPAYLDPRSIFSWKNGEEFIIRIEKVS